MLSDIKNRIFHTESKVRHKAFSKLDKYANSSVSSILKKGLYHHDKKLAQKCAHELIKRKIPNSIPIIIKAQHSGNISIISTLEILQECDTDSSFNYIIQTINKYKHPLVRHAWNGREILVKKHVVTSFNCSAAIYYRWEACVKNILQDPRQNYFSKYKAIFKREIVSDLDRLANNEIVLFMKEKHFYEQHLYLFSQAARNYFRSRKLYLYEKIDSPEGAFFRLYFPVFDSQNRWEYSKKYLKSILSNDDKRLLRGLKSHSFKKLILDLIQHMDKHNYGSLDFESSKYGSYFDKNFNRSNYYERQIILTLYNNSSFFKLLVSHHKLTDDFGDIQWWRNKVGGKKSARNKNYVNDLSELSSIIGLYTTSSRFEASRNDSVKWWLFRFCGETTKSKNSDRPMPQGCSRTHYGLKSYTTKIIKKNSGGSRVLHKPNYRLKFIQRKIYDNILSLIPVHESCHGFCKNKSISSNALPHVNQEVVIRIDLSDFFPSITANRVYGLFRSFGFNKNQSSILTNIVTYQNCLPQGAPTSPAISNLIVQNMDKRLYGLANSINAKYTRYADDITFSGDKKIVSILPIIRSIVRDEGFFIANHKTHICRKGMRQSVTGLTVNERVSVPRYIRRRIRAVIHKIDQGQEARWNGKLVTPQTMMGLSAYLKPFHAQIAQQCKESANKLIIDFI